MSSSIAKSRPLVETSSIFELTPHHSQGGNLLNVGLPTPPQQFCDAKTFTFLGYDCLQSKFALSYPSTLHDTTPKSLDFKKFGNANGQIYKTSEEGNE